MRKLGKRNIEELRTVEAFGNTTLCSRYSAKCNCDSVSRNHYYVNDAKWASSHADFPSSRYC